MNKQFLTNMLEMIQKAVEDGTTVFPLCDYLAETFDLDVSADNVTTDYRSIHDRDNVTIKILSVMLKTDKKNTVFVDARHEDGNLVYLVFHFNLDTYHMYLKINMSHMLFFDQKITYKNYENRDFKLKDSTLFEFRDFLKSSSYCFSFIDYITPFDALHAAAAASDGAVCLSDGLYYSTAFNMHYKANETLWELQYTAPPVTKWQILELRFKDYKME